MKIISKFKDYYDFLQGVYGVDEKLVLDRTNFHSPHLSHIRTKIEIHVGEWLVEGLCENGVIYYGSDLDKFSCEFKPPYYLSEIGFTKEEYYQIPNGRYSRMYVLKQPKFLGDKSPTWKEDCPILYNNIKHPILSDLDLIKVFSPEQVWLILSEWLGKRITRNEPIVPTGSDNIRIEQAGFDVKDSFRPKRKK
jgi:hypothetical protein